ncbi:MAG: phosphate ABC transporter permease subunit PstC [Candidatus Firestonebacteria bacterium]
MLKKMYKIRVKENIYKWIFTVLAFSSLIFLTGIIAVLFLEGLPVFKEIGIKDFLTGLRWYPTYEDAPQFGIFSMISASFFVTIGAMFIAVPLGLGSALFIHELAGEKAKIWLKPVIELLGAVPSIVFGFFGMVVVAPFLQNVFKLPTGLCAFTGMVVLGIMAIPTICSIAEDALSFVPGSFREASYALGANRWQTLWKVIMPAAGSGVSTALILGISRVIGETMTVLMVTGGAAVFPSSIFSPVRTMTATIAAEMGEAPVGGIHYHALFAIGLVLFFITLVLNMVAEIISRRYRVKLGLDL